MHDISSVKFRKSSKCLEEDIGTDTLCNIAFAFFNNGGQTAGVHELENDPEAFSEIECFEALDHILICFAHLHDAKFISDDFSLFIALRLNELECIHIAVLLSLYQEYTGKAAESYLFDDFVRIRRVFLAEDCCFT